MQNDITLEKFKRFKAMIISADIPIGTLMDMIENYLTADEDTPIVEAIPVLDGQLTLSESALYGGMSYDF